VVSVSVCTFSNNIVSNSSVICVEFGTQLGNMVRTMAGILEGQQN